MTPEELRREVLERPRRGFAPLPDTRVIERPGWLQLLTPSLQQGGLNEVAHSVLSDAEADQVIDATVAEYAAAGVRFRWPVTPECRPLDLAERLARRGLTRSEVRAMSRATAPALPLSPEVSVQRVGPAEAEAFTRVMAEGWGMAAGPLEAVTAAMLAQAGHALFLARVGEVAVGTAASVHFERSAYLVGAVVLPAFRRRGVYRALVAQRLEEARARGLELVTCHARADSSGPLLARLGFEELLRYPMFSSPAIDR